jgi:hypothetical protein
LPFEEREEARAVSGERVFDWDSWMAEIEKAWEERMVEEWLDGVEEGEGHLRSSLIVYGS